MKDRDRRILLGRITAAHGVRGDVVIESYAAEPGDIAAYGPLETEDGKRQLDVTVARITPKGGVIARVAGITDRTAAEGLKGTRLYVARDRLPPTLEDEFYRADLIGLRAEDNEGRTIGSITGIANYGAGEIIELTLEGSRKTELIPFTAAFVPLVDIAAGRVIVVMPKVASEDDAG